MWVQPFAGYYSVISSDKLKLVVTEENDTE
jgi:hypothetical protein